MARLYGWSVGLKPEDVICPPALLAYGWAKPGSDQDIADLMLAAGYAANGATAEQQAASIPRLPLGEYESLLLCPLSRITVDPDLILVYGNPAQMMRLVHAVTYRGEGTVGSSPGGRAGSCAEGIIGTMLSGQPQLVLPGSGDRVFAMTQDDEMIFTVPAGDIDQAIEGLTMAGRDLGLGYPIRVNQLFQPKLPPLYQVFLDSLEPMQSEPEE
jgi:uncharacterized protein (DUF169 family)